MLRYDVTTHDWVVFAPARSLRPHDFKRAPMSETPPTSRPKCPFCPGNESMTPMEIFAVRDGNGPTNWKVRVVPNKFPALRIEEDTRRTMEDGFFRSMGGCGAHEVIIDSPDHNLPLAFQPIEQIVLILQTMQQRYNDLMRDDRFQAIVIFKNQGESAGTSLTHPHSQLIATPVAPRMLRHKLSVATEYFDRNGTCLYCDMREDELSAEKRVVIADDHYVVVEPFASHVPFETWIVPKLRQSSFRWVDPALMRSLAKILKTVLQKLYVGLGDPDYNLTINTASRGDEDSEFFLWHIEILPRLTTPAGFELGSGMSINTMLPEEAASFLREIETGDAAA